MKKYSVNISFMKSAKCCDFATEVQAIDQVSARAMAVSWARSNGYNGQIKRVMVLEMAP